MSRQKYGGREKGTPNRLTTKVKDKLERILDECIESLSVDDMSKQEKLKAIQPKTIGQAARISGVSPSDINVLLIYLGR